MIQEIHKVDESIHPSGSIALSPERDLVAMLPFWIRKAREVMALNEPDPPGADELLAVLQSFMVSSLDSQDFVSTRPAEVATRVGLPKEDFNEAEARLGKWLLRVLLGSYYAGIRRSTLVGAAPVRFVDVTKPLPPAVP